MKICFIWRDVTAVGGVSTWILQCLRALPACGLEACALNLVKRGAEQLDTTDIRDQLAFISPPTRWDSPASFRWRLRRALRKLKPDVLIINEQIYAEEILQAAAGRMHVVNVVHSDRDSAYPIFMQLLQWGVPQWCVSRVIAEKLAAMALKHKEKVVYTLLGVQHPDEPRSPKWQPGTPLRLGYVGRLAKYQKRIGDLPPFVDLLRQRQVNSKVDVVGDGPEMNWLRDELQRRGLEAMVHLHGAVPHAEAMRILAQQHIYLLFSDFEGLPLTLLEAMARGVLPLVPDLPSGVSEVIDDGVNGKLFPVGQVERAADIIEALIKEPARFEQMRSQALKTAESYSFDHQLQEFKRRCDELLIEPCPEMPPINSSRMRDLIPVGIMRRMDRRTQS
jgi:glycosyltransferase involved in cell wall biosynthesis